MATAQASITALKQKEENFLKIKRAILGGGEIEKNYRVNILFDLIKNDKDYAMLVIRDKIMLSFQRASSENTAENITMGAQAVRYHPEAAAELLNNPKKLEGELFGLWSLIREINPRYEILVKKPRLRKIPSTNEE